MFKFKAVKIYLKKFSPAFYLVLAVFVFNYGLLMANSDLNPESFHTSNRVILPDHFLTGDQLNIPAMIFNPTTQTTDSLLLNDNGKTRFYFENGMMRERSNDGGDNLWRTSIALIAYKNSAFKEGMLGCTRWISPTHVQYFRSVEQTDENVSRDQVTMFLVAMALSGEDVKKYTKATKWKLSKRYKLTVDMWLWMKALGGNKLAEKMFFITQIPIAKAYQLWNKSNISKNKFPSYAVHLLAWQIYSLNSDSKYNTSLCSIVVKMADEDNYLVKLLLGFPVSQQVIDGVKPETGFQWQRDKYDQGSHIRELTPEEAEFNAIDVDVLKAIYLESCFK